MKAFTATDTSGDVRLNQLHQECNSPIKYRKVCPLHGELESDQIVSGYQYAKGQYVVIDPEELKKLRQESDKAIAVDGFYPAASIDPLCFSGKSYYLLPDGPVGQKAYHLLHRVMTDRSLCAAGKVVLFGKEQLVLVRPLEKLLAMSMLSYSNQVKGVTEFEDELSEMEVQKDELKLAETLVNATLNDEFDHALYKNTYTENLNEIIEAKVAGREIVETPSTEEPKVIEFMEALKQRVSQAQSNPVKAKAAAKKSKKIMAPSSERRSGAKKKKKKSG